MIKITYTDGTIEEFSQELWSYDDDDGNDVFFQIYDEDDEENKDNVILIKMDLIKKVE